MVNRGASRLSRRERRLWLAAGGWLLLIYSTLSFVRGPIEFLRERNLLRFTVAAVFLLAAAAVTFFLLRRRRGWRGYVVLAVFGLAYLGFFLVVERAEERLHFIEYGVLAGLIYAAFIEREERKSRCGRPTADRAWPAVASVLLTAALGWGDEGIQAILPNRVYDLRDVGLNLLAALLAVSAALAWRWAARHSR